MVCALAILHTSLCNLYFLAELIVAQGFHYFIWLNLQRSYLLYPLLWAYVPMTRYAVARALRWIICLERIVSLSSWRFASAIRLRLAPPSFLRL